MAAKDATGKARAIEMTMATGRGTGRGKLMRARILAGLAGVALTACSEPETILPGERLDLRKVYSEQVAGDVIETPVNRTVPVALPAAQVNADWTQRIGTPATRVPHAALSANPQLIWAAPIGEGDSRRQRIDTDPVVAQGRVFTLDSDATVTATSTAGQTLWQVSLVPPSDGAGQASGGGLAYGAGKLFVTSDYGTLTALDPATGGQIWQQELNGAGNAAPTVFGDLVYTTSGEELAWAVDQSDGRIVWQASTAPSVDNFSGGPAPAVTEDYVVFAFGSGEVQTSFRKGGLARWSAVISGRRPGFARANVADITGDPVVSGNTVYVGSQSGRMVAMDLATGNRLWTANEGALSPAWPASGSLFFVTDQNELVRLDASSGERIWGVKLPFFTKDRPRRQSQVFAHYGPVLAGGRMVVASSDGLIRFFDPASGALTGTAEIPGGATASPVVAGGTLYVVSKNGTLYAYR